MAIVNDKAGGEGCTESKSDKLEVIFAGAQGRQSTCRTHVMFRTAQYSDFA